MAEQAVDLAGEVAEAVGRLRAFLQAQAELGLSGVPRVGVPEGAAAGGGGRLAAFHDEIRDCRRCRLAEGRRVVVFGSGNPAADVMFVGEAPGAEEDRQGAPFVGAAGELLTRMIESIGLSREAVYIANLIKCRPPGNRDPKPDEVAACEPYLARQIEIVQPQVICTLGRFASQALLETDEPMGRLRGRVFSYRGVKLIPTYHPAALLRNERWKRPAWEDLKLLRREYDGTEI